MTVLQHLHEHVEFKPLTQVMLILQPGLFYCAGDAQAERKTLEAKWAGVQPSPSTSR